MLSFKRGIFSFLFLLLSVFVESALGSPSFLKKVIKLSNKSITVEVAESPQELEHGLMFRKSLDPNTGMLFIFPTERILGFWMKNTLIDLDIGFFDKSGLLVDIQTMESVKKTLGPLSIPTYVSKFPSKYALEVNKGWFTKNKIKLGDKLEL